MAFLIFNAGSSSLKFSLIDPDDLRVWTHGTIESPSGFERAVGRAIADAGSFARLDSSAAVEAVVHRVVHGGMRFTAPVRITPDVRAALDELTPLAPLHNPPSLEAIDGAVAALGGVPHIAVFDTAFHATLAPEARVYPLPYEWSERWGLRRFGFHGLNHEYCARRAAEMVAHSSADFRIVVAHLGNGASVTAITDGASIDTSMGFTPLEGLMMGTRSGSVDPGLLLHLQRACGVSLEELDRALNHESGLLGVSGVSSDMRTVVEAADAGNTRASLALRIFAHRARQTIGAMTVTLGRVDALVFSGGIGEHSWKVREAICSGLSCLGLDLDADANRSARPDAVVSSPSSAGRILVVEAREDVTMARAARRCLVG
jgi:acetate kinase